MRWYAPASSAFETVIGGSARPAGRAGVGTGYGGGAHAPVNAAIAASAIPRNCKPANHRQPQPKAGDVRSLLGDARTDGSSPDRA